MKNLITTVAALATLAFTYQPADACTGITLTAKDGTRILSRTIEWGGSELNSQYLVVPRGYQQQSYIPGGKVDGLRFTVSADPQDMSDWLSNRKNSWRKD